MLMMTQHLSSASGHRELSPRKSVRSASRGNFVSLSATLATKASGLVRRAGTLLLLAGFGVAICNSSAAHADSRGALGPVSKGSIGISITIRPQVRVAAQRVETPTVGSVANAGAGQICLTTNMSQGEFTVSMESLGADSAMQETTSPLAIDAAASARCSLASSNQNQAKAVAFAIGPAAAPQPGLVLLMVSPD